MDRRSLLKLAVAGGALGTAGMTAGLSALQPRRQRWPSWADGRSERVTRARRVVVVGGGLAGISAASTLALRGYEVVLLEAGDRLGGKVTGWPAEVLGETVPMEHGFHGFFAQYYTLRDLLARAGADADLVRQPSYTVLLGDGREEPFGGSSAPFPLDLLEVLARSPSLSFADVAGDRPGMNALLAYDREQTFARWDGMDAATFVREGGLEGPFADLILRPFGQASMNGLGSFSAAELIRFFHFYMLGNPEGLAFDVLGRGSHLSIVGRLREHLEDLGVDVRTGSPVSEVLLDGSDLAGVRLGRRAPRPVSVLRASLGPTWTRHGEVLLREGRDGPEALDARCTHLGCPVRPSGEGLHCPCHGGRYDRDGRNLSGPPPRPLEPLPVRLAGERVEVEVQRPEATLEADAVILAVDSRALRSLVRGEVADRLPRLVEQLQDAGEAEPYVVARFWLDQPVSPERTPFYTVGGFRHTDSIATYSAFQQPFVDWAARTGGSVVECHAYAVPAEELGTVEELGEALLAELRTAFPELATASVLHREVMLQDDFTRFAPGDAARRPGVQTELPGLLLAGDHVDLPFPAFLMEAAAASGRLAANRICADDGVLEDPIRTVALRGTLAGVLPDA